MMQQYMIRAQSQNNRMLDQQYIQDVRAVTFAKHRKVNSASMIKVEEIDPKTPRSENIDDLHIPSFNDSMTTRNNIGSVSQREGRYTVTMPDGSVPQPPRIASTDMITPGYVYNDTEQMIHNDHGIVQQIVSDNRRDKKYTDDMAEPEINEDIEPPPLPIGPYAQEASDSGSDPSMIGHQNTEGFIGE